MCSLPLKCVKAVGNVIKAFPRLMCADFPMKREWWWHYHLSVTVTLWLKLWFSQFCVLRNGWTFHSFIELETPATSRVYYPRPFESCWYNSWPTRYCKHIGNMCFIAVCLWDFFKLGILGSTKRSLRFLKALRFLTILVSWVYLGSFPVACSLRHWTQYQELEIWYTFSYVLSYSQNECTCLSMWNLLLKGHSSIFAL